LFINYFENYKKLSILRDRTRGEWVKEFAQEQNAMTMIGMHARPLGRVSDYCSVRICLLLTNAIRTVEPEAIWCA